MKFSFRILVALLLIPGSFSYALQKTCTITESFPVATSARANPNDHSENEKLDILWVIDDSSSMESHQTNLKENIRHFFHAFDSEPSVDFRMGMVTTGLRIVTDKQTDQPVRLTIDSDFRERKEFRNLLLVGTSGDPSEKGAAAVSVFLRSQPDFVRAGSHVQINILTDEDDETESVQLYAMRSHLRRLQSEGHRITINLIAIGGSVKRYRQHFQGFDLHFYPLLSDDFSKDIRKLADKSIGKTILDLELQFEPKKIVSIHHQAPKVNGLVKHHEMLNEHILRADLGVLKDVSDSKVEVTYEYACAAINRSLSKKLIKRIAEIDFHPNLDVFLHPEVANATVDDVYEFLRRNENARIKLIGAVSYSGNPLNWLKMKIKDPNDRPNAYRVSKSRAKKIRDELIARGIAPDRIQSKGAFPGLHRHWYSYLLDLTFYDVFSEFCLACDIESDRRVIMKVFQK